MTRVASVTVLLLLCGIVAGKAQDPAFNSGMEAFRSGEYDRALEALQGFAAAQPQSPQAGEALFTVAAIQAAKGDAAGEEAALRKLVSACAGSPWVPGALDRLAGIAAGRRDWDGAIAHAIKFLDAYLPGKYGTMDDPVSAAMFRRMAQYAGSKTPGASDEQVHKALRSLTSVESMSGRVVALFTGPDPDWENLVLNPGFEWDERPVGTPAAWTYRGTMYGLGDDWDGAVMEGEPFKINLHRPRTGRFALGKFTEWRPHLGWMFQQVPVVPGRRYEVSAWALCVITKGGPAKLRLGVDLSGGTDPESSEVRWVGPVSPTKDWEKLAFEGAAALEAKGRHLTVFLEGNQPVEADDNVWQFDDVSVRTAK